MKISTTLAVLALAWGVRGDGSTITVSTTQFNPAITNQGGTTNAAGTFNVSPLATSMSYEFQTLQQTSTFVPGAVNTQAAQGGGGNSGGNGGSGSGSGNSGNIGGGTVVVTATAPTSTVNMGSTSGAGGSSVATASNGLPSLALGSTNAAVQPQMASVWPAVVAVLGATMGVLALA
ncbi:uncharacterized protein PAN0_008d3399 [Moesziomyces antarcticus]|uniref:Uncharacterized protein n=2 Tax=Pseudozyma antarctica TaxID=84753 RepID=A0A081CET6_PSEA2|nr:uncharacterized protein PAN0_008d3399 [Moesziomyces antarcticus]GAK65182.1 conserved hypothetical protein [Moesziomyces antarcticus]SPO46184.1 uncharacterized protein PSANT_03870 [Moesziomyces antarcticus]